MQMEMHMKANGKMIKQMEMVSIFTKKVHFMKENGKMIFNKDKEGKNGLMALNLKGNTLME